MGDQLEEAKQLDTAYEFRVRAREAAALHGDSARIVSSHAQLGALEQLRGRLTTAVECFEEALATARAATLDPRGVAAQLVGAKVRRRIM